jgi:hypothetical protein
MAVNAVQQNKTVADPNAAYESIIGIWRRNRAICGGERFTKEYDGYLDKVNFSNLLIPFSASMDAKQYAFYRSEAELPGIVAEYARMLVGSLLRKKPQLTLPESLPEEIKDWILNEFGVDNSPLSSVIDDYLWEEIQTSRCWIQIDYPEIPKDLLDTLTPEELLKFKPYPIKWTAESVINWNVTLDIFGKKTLSRVIIRTYEENVKENEFHPDLDDVVYVHELFQGHYRIRKYIAKTLPNTPVVNGQIQKQYDQASTYFELVDIKEDILLNGERLTFIPLWPLNGSIDVVEPMLSALVDKEVALYNKMSRRNHLLYGAATYTPYIASNMSDDDFKKIVRSGLGSWIKLDQGDGIGALETPTAALADMEKAIASAIEEMAKLGIRMLTPETDQSGVALHLRNAAQTAKLGTLNMKISGVLAEIIVFMINWRYRLDLKPSDIQFSLSSDFTPTPTGEGWLRLATEWYEGGLIPRSVWLQLLKQNDMLPPEYDDKKGQIEITEDEVVITKQEQTAFNNSLSQQY